MLPHQPTGEMDASFNPYPRASPWLSPNANVPMPARGCPVTNWVLRPLERSGENLRLYQQVWTPVPALSPSAEWSRACCSFPLSLSVPTLSYRAVGNLKWDRLKLHFYLTLNIMKLSFLWSQSTPAASGYSIRRLGYRTFHHCRKWYGTALMQSNGFWPFEGHSTPGEFRDLFHRDTFPLSPASHMYNFAYGSKKFLNNLKPIKTPWNSACWRYFIDVM